MYTKCMFDGCERSTYAKDLCKAHYNQIQRGEGLRKLAPPKGVPTANSLEEFFWRRVRKQPGCWIWTGAKIRLGYGQIKFSGHSIQLAHRYSWELHREPLDGNTVIDHLCHTPSCVNPDHLRATSHRKNSQNRKGAAKHSKSGVRNVQWDQARNRWRVRLRYNGQEINIGTYKDLDEAAASAQAARVKYFGLTSA